LAWFTVSSSKSISPLSIAPRKGNPPRMVKRRLNHEEQDVID